MPNYDFKFDEKSASMTIRGEYREDINFREACFYTANLIRRTTRKNLVFLHSGGADSTAFSFCFRHENIDIKRVHIRYFYRGNLINFYETNNIYEEDVVMYDIDVEEFEKSEQHKYVNSILPYHVFLSLQTCYPDIDPENDFLIRGASTLPIRKINGKFIYNISVGSTALPFLYKDGCECVDFLQHNPIILSSVFTDKFVLEQVNSMSENQVYSWLYKEELYKHYFPEIDPVHLIRKQSIASWPGISHLAIDAGRGIFYNYDGSIIDIYPQRTHWKFNYKKIVDYIKSNYVMTMNVKWNFDGDFWTMPRMQVFLSPGSLYDAKL